MARCLRCKAGNEWIEGDVRPLSAFGEAARLHEEAAERQFAAGDNNLGHYEAAWGRVFRAMEIGAVNVTPPSPTDSTTEPKP